MFEAVLLVHDPDNLIEAERTVLTKQRVGFVDPHIHALLIVGGFVRPERIEVLRLTMSSRSRNYLTKRMRGQKVVFSAKILSSA